MAPMRSERGGSPARGQRASLPLPRRLIRQIARHVASSGRSLRRLEVSGRVIDNFDDIEAMSDESDLDLDAPQPARAACGGNAGNLPPPDNDNDLTSLSWLQDKNLLRGLLDVNQESSDWDSFSGTESESDTSMQDASAPILPDPVPSLLETALVEPPPRTVAPTTLPRPRTVEPKIPSPRTVAPTLPPPRKVEPTTLPLPRTVVEHGQHNGKPLGKIPLTVVKKSKCPRHEMEAIGINLSKGVEDSAAVGRQLPQLLKSAESTKTPPPTARPLSPPHTPCKAPPSPPTALTKPPYSFSCLIFMAIEAAPTRALPVKEIYAWIVRHFPYFKHAPQGWKNSVRHNLSLNKCFHKVAAAPGLGKGSLWTVDPQHRGTLLQAFGRQPIPAAPPDTPPAKNAPDPQLFPFLARRLAGDEVKPAAEPGADEYLAAATVLAMKYGPSVLDQLPPAAHLIISRCARDEHSYSGGFEERRTAEALLNLAGVRPEPPASPAPS